MALNLTVGSVIEKNKIASDVAYILLLQIRVINPINESLVETVYICNNKEDITFNSQVYTAASFDVDIKQQSGALAEITLVIQDFTRGIQTLMQEYGGGVGFEVKVLYVNSSALDSDPEIEENFKVTGASAQGYVSTFTLGAENPLSKRCPKRLQHREICSFTYKSTECGSNSTLPTCDYTLTGDNGCIMHSNGQRFGGFPGITG